MTAVLDFLRTIRPDKWLHALTSVVIFAAVHYATGNARIAIRRGLRFARREEGMGLPERPARLERHRRRHSGLDHGRCAGMGLHSGAVI